MTDDRTRLLALRDELRRVVYGTPGGHLGDEADQLAAVEDALRPPPAVDEPPELELALGFSRLTKPDEAYTGSPEAETSARQPATIRVGRLAVRRRTAIAVGVALFFGTALAAGPIRDALEPETVAVFARAQVGDDRLPVSRTPLVDADQSSVRQLGAVGGYRFWGFRDGDSAICLAIGTEAGPTWSSRCMTPARFAADGHAVVIPWNRVSELARPDGFDAHEFLLVQWEPEDAEIDWRVVTSYELAELEAGIAT